VAAGVKMKTYPVAIAAQSRASNLLFLATYNVEADSEDEARGIAVKIGDRQFPVGRFFKALVAASDCLVAKHASITEQVGISTPGHLNGDGA
jgi:hypothetical protein